MSISKNLSIPFKESIHLNNSDKPIGIFDSGLGGLTALKAITELLPNENIIYLADSDKLPYGNKTKEQIVRYVCADTDFLAEAGVKAVLIACNTADSLARAQAEKRYSFPVAGVVAPAAETAAAATKNGRIGVLATSATISSGIYENELMQLVPECKVFGKAAPRLVPLIESGKAHRGDIDFEQALSFYLQPFTACGIDTLILGCTHYPVFYDMAAELLDRKSVV